MYVTLQDIRDEGFDVDDISDDRAEFLSAGWQQWFETRTGMWFESKSLDLLVDGNGSRVLWLPIPVISLTELYINDDFVNEIDSSYYTVYNRYQPEDDRKNPRIKMKRSSSDSIFTSSGSYIFEVGDQNQKLVGDFGYVEEDGSVPFAVVRAIMQLIATTINTMSDGDIDALRMGSAIEEVTDRHRIRFANLYDDISKWSPTGLSEVDNALQMYRRPMNIGMARRW